MRESACLSLERLTQGLRTSPEALSMIAACGVVPRLLELLNPEQPGAVTGARSSTAVRVLAMLARNSPAVAPQILMGDLSVLAPLLPTADQPSDQLQDSIAFFAELLPG